ncbi:MAG: methanogen output domain 1-containing protein [Methanobacterium sp.]|jgi:hypothetical protein
MEKDKHLKQKTMELHDSFIKEMPLFVSNSQLREALIQNFVGCFEEIIRPRFTKEMKLQGKGMKDPEAVSTEPI